MKVMTMDESDIQEIVNDPVWFLTRPYSATVEQSGAILGTLIGAIVGVYLAQLYNQPYTIMVPAAVLGTAIGTWGIPKMV